VLGFAVRNPELRRLLRLSVALSVALRRPIAPVGLLFADLLRVGLMRRIATRAGTRGRSMRIEWAGDEHSLTLRTVPSGPATAVPVRDAWGPPRRLIWDHSAIGTEVRPPLIWALGSTVQVGQDGIYRFEALEAIALRAPEAVRAAIEPRTPIR
jgi:hypothetical protein